MLILGSDLFGVETDGGSVADVRDLGKAGLMMLTLPTHTTVVFHDLDRGIFGTYRAS
jgi:hypothetical protein